MDALEEAVRDALRVDRPVVIDALVDPSEYAAHHPPQRAQRLPSESVTKKA